MSNTWKVNAMKKEIPILNPTDKYTYWLIPKFTPIANGARLTSKRLAKMIIKDIMISQEKDLLTKILYNQEIILIWDFKKMGKVKNKVVFA